MGTNKENEDFNNLLLALGMCAGGIDVGNNRFKLVDALKSGELHAGYIIGLRDRLTSILNESGVDLRTVS
jgi:hypothetical protein